MKRRYAGIVLIVVSAIALMFASLSHAVIPAFRAAGVQFSAQSATPIAATKQGVWIDTSSRVRLDDGTTSIAMLSRAVPTCVVGTGAGAGASCVILAGATDSSGTLTVTTSVAATPSASADIVSINFSSAFPTIPKVRFIPSNDATWALAYGVSRYRDSDTTVSLFKIRSGTTPLPALTAATYSWSWHSAP